MTAWPGSGPPAGRQRLPVWARGLAAAAPQLAAMAQEWQAAHQSILAGLQLHPHQARAASLRSLKPYALMYLHAGMDAMPQHMQTCNTARSKHARSVTSNLSG